MVALSTRVSRNRALGSRMESHVLGLNLCTSFFGGPECHWDDVPVATMSRSLWLKPPEIQATVEGTLFQVDS